MNKIENTTAATVANAEQLLSKGSLPFDAKLLRGEEERYIKASPSQEAFIQGETLPDYLCVVTHNGAVHADEVWACAMIKYFLATIGKNVVFERTRRPEDWSDSEFVVDVGEGILDHHGPRAEVGVSAATRVFLLLRNTFYTSRDKRF